MNYSTLDRLLHRIAFSAPSIQLTAADFENKFFGATYSKAKAERPIFITSLPRAGTTILLEALALSPNLASHTYRDMPFIMAPLLWSRLSNAFHKETDLQERAHGDGIAIGYDSPEAFEEILWRTFWPQKYNRNAIALSTASDFDEYAQAFFIAHIKKIVALRRSQCLNDARYVSKNNGNIARIDLIHRMFPDATVVVPFRQPLSHAASLLRQHRNFLDLQNREPFVRRYMGDLGHYEFGELHRPIAFPGLAPLISGRDSMTLDYWVSYWIGAFEHLLSHHDKVNFIAFESILADPQATLAKLSRLLGFSRNDHLEEGASLIKPSPAYELDKDSCEIAKQVRAETLYKSLLDKAI